MRNESNNSPVTKTNLSLSSSLRHPGSEVFCLAALFLVLFCFCFALKFFLFSSHLHDPWLYELHKDQSFCHVYLYEDWGTSAGKPFHHAPQYSYLCAWCTSNLLFERNVVSGSIVSDCSIKDGCGQNPEFCFQSHNDCIVCTVLHLFLHLLP